MWFKPRQFAQLICINAGEDETEGDPQTAQTGACAGFKSVHKKHAHWAAEGSGCVWRKRGRIGRTGFSKPLWAGTGGAAIGFWGGKSRCSELDGKFCPGRTGFSKPLWARTGGDACAAIGFGGGKSRCSELDGGFWAERLGYEIFGIGTPFCDAGGDAGLTDGAGTDSLLLCASFNSSEIGGGLGAGTKNRAAPHILQKWSIKRFKNVQLPQAHSQTSWLWERRLGWEWEWEWECATASSTGLETERCKDNPAGVASSIIIGAGIFAVKGRSTTCAIGRPRCGRTIGFAFTCKDGCGGTDTARSFAGGTTAAFDT